MKYLKAVSEFNSPVEARPYLEAQEKLLLDCLYGDNKALKPADIKNFIPVLVREWKKYINTPGVSSSDQNSAIIHCVELLRFKKRHKYSFDYEQTIMDPQHTGASGLETSLRRSEVTTADMILVRDLRIV